MHTTPMYNNVIQQGLILRQNAIKMAHSFPSTSHFRLQLLSGLVPELPTSVCANLLNTLVRTIQRAKNINFNETEITTRWYASNTTRQYISPAEIRWILLFVIEICPTPSGFTIEIYLQTIECRELYELYCQRVASHNEINDLQFHTRSEQVFFRISRILHICRVKTYWSWSKCPYCSKEKDMSDDHLHAKEHQHQVYRETYDQLQLNQVL
jgi:hypothetical protein